MSKTTMHKGQMKDIRQDIHLPTLVTKDRYKDESDYCQICRLRGKRRIAEHYCTRCALPMCAGCKDTHENTRVTGDHIIVPKQERDVSTETCPVHRFAKVQYFCDTCLQLVCVNCTMIEHKKHNIMELPDKVEQCHRILSDTVIDLDERLRRFEDDLKRLNDHESEIENNRDAVKSEINSQVVYLQQRIRAQQEDLLRQLDRYLDDKVQAISKQKEVIEQRYNETMNARVTADLRNRQDMQDEAIIQNVIQLEKKMGKLKGSLPIEDNNFKHMTFVMTNDARLGRMEESNMPIAAKPTIHKKGKGGRSVPGVSKLRAPRVGKLTNGVSGIDNDELNNSDPNPPLSGRSEFNHSHIPQSHSEPAQSRSSRHAPLTQSRSSQNSPTKRQSLNSSHATTASVVGDTDAPNLRIMQRFKTINYQQNPSGIGVLPNGKYVIIDATNYGILMCDKSGRWQQRMLQDEVAFPTGIAITREGDIAVATHKYIKIFRVDGIKLRQFQVAGSNVGALAIDDYGHFVVIDHNSKKVVIYDDEGLQLRTMEPPDLKGMRPDAFNIGVGGDHLALSYTSANDYSVVKLYNHRGDLIKSCDLPQPCRGIQMDRFGNMIVAAGDLLYAPAKGNDIMPLRAVDKKAKSFRMYTRCVAFTPQGLITTLHVNKINQRSELMILHLGG